MLIRNVASVFLRTLGYFSLSLQWLWAAMIGLPLLLKTKLLEALMISQAPQPNPMPADTADPTPLALIVGGAVTVLFLALTAYILLRAPRVVQKTGDRMIETTSQAVLPVLTQHQPLPVKKRKELTLRIQIGLVALVTVLPLVICLLLPAPSVEISKDIVTIVASTLALMSLLTLTLGYVLRVRKPTSRTRLHASRG
jgi:phosphatidylserine synthase